MIKYNKDIGVARTGVVTLRAAGWLFLIFINYTTDCPMVNAIWEHFMSHLLQKPQLCCDVYYSPLRSKSSQTATYLSPFGGFICTRLFPSSI